MTKLNISLVLYNTKEDELARLLYSLEQQTRVDFKLLILDNSTHAVTFNKSGYRYEIDYQKSFCNLGFGRAHNANFKRSDRGAYFLIINPDIYFDDPLLLNQFLLRSTKMSLTSVRILNPDGSTQEVHRLFPRFTDICRRFILKKLGVYSSNNHSYTLGHIDKTKDFVCPNISGCFMLFAPGLYEETGGFDEGLFLYFEDTDLSRRCFVATSGNNVVHGDLFVFHTWQGQGYKSIESFKLQVLSAAYYFQKYGIFRDEYSRVVNQEIEKLAGQ